jgi:CHAT domain-containing protein/Tfp pilus assembly protein PilF
VLAIAPAQDTQAGLERRAADAFAKNDCAAASRLYTAALDLARASGQSAKSAFYDRRIGICAYRAGDMDGALTAYRNGLAAADAAKDHDMLFENLHGSVLSLRHLGRLTEATNGAQRELAIAEECGHVQHVSRALANSALLSTDMGQTARAQQYYERLLGFARANHDTAGVELANENLALVYGALGDPETGIRHLKDALAQVPPNDILAQGRYESNLGMMLKLAGRLSEAQTYYEAALRHTARPDAWRNREAVAYNMGMLEVDLGNLPAAKKYLEESLKAIGGGRDLHVEAQVRAALAEVLLDLKQTAEAAAAAREAVAIARRAGSPAALFPALAALGRAEEASGKSAEAGAALEEAAEIVEALRAGAAGDPAALEATLKQGYSVYQAIVGHLLAAGRVEDALVWAEKAKARVLNDLLLKGGLDERSVMSDDERREERLLYGKVARAAADRKRSAAAIGELETFRRRLYARHPELALQRADFGAAGPAQWRSLLPDARAALLEFFQLREGAALFVVRQQGVRVVRLKTGAAALAAEVRRFREQVAARDVNYTARARSLFAALIEPAKAELDGTAGWIISPDGALWELPFQTLIAPDGKHLLETHAISYTPSLTALWEIRRRHANVAPAPLEVLAVGNPGLAAAEEEARQVAGLYSPQQALVLTGADASQERFREQAPRAAVIHIATHAELNAANPMYSTLALNPGTLPAAEILRMPLHARLAVLSACETARGKTAQGSELLGMGWALTGAGAAASVVSQWKVDSAATASLMVAFHRNLRKPLPPAEALRRAALEVRALPGDHNPFYWAGFLVLGDGYR